MSDVVLDSNGLNAAITAVALDDAAMRARGFTDHREGFWYLCHSVAQGITFNLTIPKDGGRPKIDVIDEDFGQPYDYQAILRRNPEFGFAAKVRDVVEYVMHNLTQAGIIKGWEYDMYI